MLRRIALGVLVSSFVAGCGGGHPVTDGGPHDGGGDSSTMPDGGGDMTTMPDGHTDMTTMPDTGADMTVTDTGVDMPAGDMGMDMMVADMGPMCPMATDLMSMVGIGIGMHALTGTEPTNTFSCSDTRPVEAFVWTAPAAGTYAIDTIGSDFDTLLAAFAMTCTGMELSCNDDVPEATGPSRIDLTVAAGDVILLEVMPFDATGTGTITISITQPPADESTGGNCHDGMDNDRDGAADCLDSDCVAADPSCTETNCNNGVDDDMDGAIDCADSDCSTLPICVAPNCGNGTIDTGETCDDGNTTAGDGCDDFCNVEPFYMCTGTPSVCTVTPKLVVNELDYDNMGTDMAEFVEVYNPTPIAVDMTNLAVVLVNGGGTPPAEYRRFALATAVDSTGATVTTLPSHGYVVIADTGLIPSLPATSLRIAGIASNMIQNGPNDGVAITDTVALTVMDALSYDGMCTGTITGFAAPVSLVEGTPFPTADTPDDLHSLCRDPNGSDTNDAATDWFLTTTITPGADNVATP